MVADIQSWQMNKWSRKNHHNRLEDIFQAYKYVPVEILVNFSAYKS